jgi:ribosome-binding ATPase YchF (GTP1/OBG family)
MAAHPFTTISPNIGYCLVPAPLGSCPEDSTEQPGEYSSTHGRSPDGRRLLPVLLKDVAGLVPGAYQGR